MARRTWNESDTSAMCLGHWNEITSLCKEQTGDLDPNFCRKQIARQQYWQEG